MAALWPSTPKLPIYSSLKLVNRSEADQVDTAGTPILLNSLLKTVSVLLKWTPFPTINNLKSENSKLVEENNKLKDLLKDNEILKSVIDELGISEWDIIDKDQEILESCIDENENKNENETGDV